MSLTQPQELPDDFSATAQNSDEAQVAALQAELTTARNLNIASFVLLLIGWGLIQFYGIGLILIGVSLYLFWRAMNTRSRVKRTIQQKYREIREQQ